MEEQKSLNPKAHRIATLFNPARVIREQEVRIVQLEAGRADLTNLPPEKALRTLALQLFREGSYDMAMTYSEAALKLDPGIFNSVDITVPNLDDADRLDEINMRLPRVNIVAIDPTTESNYPIYALYYVYQARRKLEEKRIFSALRLFEKALSFDENVIEDGPGLLPQEIQLFPLFLIDSENKFGDKIRTICQFGCDYISLPAIFFSLGNVTFEPLLVDHSEGLEIIKDFKGYESQPEDKSKAFLVPLINLLYALGYINTLKWAIRNNYNTQVLDSMGISALTWAILFGRIDVVNYLVVNGIVDINNTMTNEETPSLLSMSPISLAAYYNQYDITQYIIYKIKDINIRENENWTPLMYASMGQNIEIVRLLLRFGALVELKNDKGSTAITLATVLLDINIELLVLLCSSVKDYENCDNFTKFLVSAFRGDEDAIRNILSSNVDKKFLSREEEPALLLAAHGGHRETIRLLISYGARISDHHHVKLPLRLVQIIDQVQNETSEKFTI